MMVQDEIRMKETYRERSIIKSIILVALKEVRITIGVLQGSINVIWDAFPVGDWLGIC